MAALGFGAFLLHNLALAYADMAERAKADRRRVFVSLRAASHEVNPRFRGFTLCGLNARGAEPTPRDRTGPPMCPTCRRKADGFTALFALIRMGEAIRDRELRA